MAFGCKKKNVKNIFLGNIKILHQRTDYFNLCLQFSFSTVPFILFLAQADTSEVPGYKRKQLTEESLIKARLENEVWKRVTEKYTY